MRGQALVEYLLVLMFVVGFGNKALKGLSGFIGDSFGKLAHTISKELSTGVCENQCFMKGYYNSWR